jgi:hypothetical protein
MIAVDKMSLPRRRMLAIAILIGVVLSAVALVVLPVAAMLQSPKAQIEQATRLLATYQAHSALKPEFVAKLTAINHQLATDPGLIAAASAALAQATIQGELQALAARNGATIHSLQSLTGSRNGDYEEIQVRCDLSVPLAHLRDMIYALEAHTPYFFLGDVEIQVPDRVLPPDAKTEPPQPQLRWTIIAYRWAAAT